MECVSSESSYVNSSGSGVRSIAHLEQLTPVGMLLVVKVSFEQAVPLGQWEGDQDLSIMSQYFQTSACGSTNLSP